MAALTPNTGTQPTGTAGKRVRVRLRNGSLCKDEGGQVSPAGWAADSTRWTLTGEPFDVLEWEQVGF